MAKKKETSEQPKLGQPKVELLTMENVKEKDIVTVVPSFDIIHALVSLMGQKGLQGEIYKDNDKLMIATGFEMSMELEQFLKMNQAFKIIKKQ